MFTRTRLAAILSSLGMAGIGLAASTVVATPAAAAGPCTPGRVHNGVTFTETFCFTGGSQTWTVPVGVSQATFTLYGAEGGTASTLEPGGVGGGVTATLPVVAGTMLQLNAGQGWPRGGGTSAGATFGGGGAAGPAAGGGGGATDVRTPAADGTYPLANRLLVAGGGGGGGRAGGGSTSAIPGGRGGNGDCPDAPPDQIQPPCAATVGSRTAEPGVQLGGGGGGGSGGANNPVQGAGPGPGGSGGGVNGTATSSCAHTQPGGPGGSGGTQFIPYLSPTSPDAGGGGGPGPLPGTGGGGGGGGYFGGGGGGGGAIDDGCVIFAGGGGGGGGSNYVASSATRIQMFDNVGSPDLNGNGEVVISWTAKEPSNLGMTGATTSDFNDPAVVSAVLSDSKGLLAGRSLTFTLNGAETCSATTDATGSGSCSLTPHEAAGSYPLTVSFSDDATHLGTSASSTFGVTLEETVLTYTGPDHAANGQPLTLSGTLREDGSVPISGRTVTFTIGSGSSAQSCSSITDAGGSTSCTIASVSQPASATTMPVIVAFTGDAFYKPASASATLGMDLALHITRIAAGANQGRPAAAGVAFKDDDPNGNLSQFSGTISWGDSGPTSNIPKSSFTKVPPSFGGGFAAGSTHTYAKPGTYTVIVTINDVGGASASKSTTLVVPNP